MAVLPDYVTGTITLANGSTTVTGTGTMFATAAFRPGDTLQIQNLTAIIASVDSNTSLTLTEPWTGTSLTNAPYRARYLPDGARVTAQTTTLIELLGNGVLSNIAGIPVEDGNLLIGNTAGQYETISKDELGVQDPNGSLGKLAALTLAARQILQTDQAGALKQVALAANKALVTDANQDVQQIDLSAIGRSILNMDGSADQLIRGDGTLIPILGTMDAGALMETGNNANGSYFRFRSGLQITARVSSTFTVQSPAGNMFVNGAAAPPYTLPATFSAEPYELITGHNLSGTGHCWAASVTRPTTTQSSSVQLFRATADAGPFFFKLVHIGRWQ
nr:hypothetical protein [Brucella intermedia]